MLCFVKRNLCFDLLKCCCFKLGFIFFFLRLSLLPSGRCFFWERGSCVHKPFQESIVVCFAWSQRQCMLCNLACHSSCWNGQSEHLKKTVLCMCICRGPEWQSVASHIYAWVRTMNFHKVQRPMFCQLYLSLLRCLRDTPEKPRKTWRLHLLSPIPKNTNLFLLQNRRK